MVIEELRLKTGQVIIEDWFTKLCDLLERLEAAIKARMRSFEGVAKTVTETVLTLKDECLAIAPREFLIPLNVTVEYDNPSGSGVTLHVEARLYFDDKTEATIDAFDVAEGVAGSREYLSNFIARAFKDGVGVSAVRSYASVTATPATGLEPTLTLRFVKGYQF